MTGRTADGTWQLGVRRTAAVPLDFVWQALVDDPAALLGVPLRLEVGVVGEAGGVEVRVRSLTPRVVVRMGWLEPGWERPSSVQVRVLTAASGTTMSVAHERLPTEADRLRLLPIWTDRVETWLATVAGPLDQRT